MAERRYGFRFNGMEGGLLLGGVLLTSFLIFVSGVYVGREVAGRKGIIAQSQVVRVPVSSFSDQMVTKSIPVNDSAVTRTASLNIPLAWPVAREKVVPPTPPVAKVDEAQPKEKEREEPTPASANKPVVPANVPRTSPPLTAKEDNPPSRTKPVVEPFVPKLPVAVASRTEKSVVSQNHRVEVKTPMPQTSHNETEERKLDTQNPRSEIVAKKPSPVMIANVEKIEPSTRSRGPALEGKRAGNDKNTETKPPLAEVKKTPKQLAGWRVQVGATTYQETAQDMARELRELGYDPMVSSVQMNGETLYRVRIGKFGKQGEAVAAVGRFRREGRFSQAYLVSE